MSKAPDIKNSYPSAGQFIGPLWQRMWDHLSDGQWVTAWTLADATAADPDQEYEAAKGTVQTLLHEAAKAGLVERNPGERQKRYTLFRRPVGAAPVIRPGEFVPPPAKRPQMSEAVAERMDAVLGVLYDAGHTGLTWTEWIDRCVQRAGVPNSTARRYAQKLMDAGDAVDPKGQPVTHKTRARGMRLVACGLLPA